MHTWHDSTSPETALALRLWARPCPFHLLGASLARHTQRLCRKPAEGQHCHTDQRIPWDSTGSRALGPGLRLAKAGG